MLWEWRAFEPLGEGLWVEGDPAQLGQVTMNLLTNAYEATSAAGRASGSVRISVTHVTLDAAELLDMVKRTGAPDVPVATRPLEEVNAALNDLRDGRVIGRVVMTPAG